MSNRHQAAAKPATPTTPAVSPAPAVPPPPVRTDPAVQAASAATRALYGTAAGGPTDTSLTGAKGVDPNSIYSASVKLLGQVAR